MRYIAFLVILAVSFDISADEKLDAVLKRGVERREKELARLDETIETLNADLKLLQKSTVNTKAKKTQVLDSGKKVFTSKEARTKSIEAVEAKIAKYTAQRDEIKALKYILPEITVDSLKVGSIGVPVLQSGAPADFEIQSVVDKDNAVAKVGDLTLWLEMPTVGMVDGKRFAYRGLMETTGTRSYKTVGGTTKTVFTLRPLLIPKEQQ